jgi:hypothetical protein
VTLKVKMSGSGNLRTAVEPPALEIPGARVYPPTVKNSSTRNAGRPAAQSDWTYVIVPTTPGDLTIPSLKVAVFDPSEKRVVEKATEPLHVFVEGAAAAHAADARSGSAETVPAPEPKAPAAAVADAGPAARAAGPPARTAPAQPSTLSVDLSGGTVTIPLWALAGIPAFLLAAGGTALAVRKRFRARGEVASAISGEAGEPKERAAARIDRALRQLIQKRYGIPETAPASAILEGLETAGVPEEVRDGVRTLMAELDFLRFAPQLGEYGDKIDEARRQAAWVLRRLG